MHQPISAPKAVSAQSKTASRVAIAPVRLEEYVFPNSIDLQFGVLMLLVSLLAYIKLRIWYLDLFFRMTGFEGENVKAAGRISLSCLAAGFSQ